VSKSLGPDLRVAILAGDPATVARVEGRQMVGTGWVSRILQEVVATLWADAATERRLAAASAAYSARRADLVDALAAQGIRAHGRSGFNVWIPVAEESRTVSALAAAGWAVRPGERYRIKTPPAIRVTISTLGRRDAQRFAADLARSLQPESRTQFT
jgi:DNA-binding transcriptional MocR family regulator